MFLLLKDGVVYSSEAWSCCSYNKIKHLEDKGNTGRKVEFKESQRKGAEGQIDPFWVSFYTWYEVGVQFRSCWRGYSVVPAPIVEKTILSPIALSWYSHRKQLTINIWVVLAAFLSQRALYRSPSPVPWLTQWPWLWSLGVHGPHFPVRTEFRPPAPLFRPELRSWHCQLLLYSLCFHFLFSY